MVRFIGRPVGRMAAHALTGMGLKIQVKRIFRNDHEFINSYSVVFLDTQIEISDNFVSIDKRYLPLFVKGIIESGYKYPFTVYGNKGESVDGVQKICLAG